MRYETISDNFALRRFAYPENEDDLRSLCEAPWRPGLGVADRRGTHRVSCSCPPLPKEKNR